MASHVVAADAMRPRLPPIEKRMARVRPVAKRRWWRAEGPQDPSLPEGYAYASDGWERADDR